MALQGIGVKMVGPLTLQGIKLFRGSFTTKPDPHRGGLKTPYLLAGLPEGEHAVGQGG